MCVGGDWCIMVRFFLGFIIFEIVVVLFLCVVGLVWDEVFGGGF